MITAKEENSTLLSLENDAPVKKAYTMPRLIVHGTLQEITGNVGNGFVDFPEGSQIAG